MALRQLTNIEKRHHERPTAYAIVATFIQPTYSGFKKSILDATIPVSNSLRDKGLRDHELQGQGATEHGAQLEAVLIDGHKSTVSRASLYRPKTKQGDPRIWFSGLPDFAHPDDILPIMAKDGRLRARVHERDGHDYFEFREVIHTRKSILSQFDLLLEQGEITMDHLIKRNPKGRVSEKGPLFNISAASLGLLFPPSKSYALP